MYERFGITSDKQQQTGHLMQMWPRHSICYQYHVLETLWYMITTAWIEPLHKVDLNISKHFTDTHFFFFFDTIQMRDVWNDVTSASPTVMSMHMCSQNSPHFRRPLAIWTIFNIASRSWLNAQRTAGQPAQPSPINHGWGAQPWHTVSLSYLSLALCLINSAPFGPMNYSVWGISESVLQLRFKPMITSRAIWHDLGRTL